MMKPRPWWAWSDRTAWVLGLLGVCVAVLLQGWGTPALRQQTMALEQALSAHQQAAREAAERRAAAALDQTNVDPLAQLPPASSQHTRLAQLAQTIGRAQVQGESIDLVTTVDPSTGVAMSRVAQTAKGRYSDVRQALRLALDADPALALEDLRLSRPNADQPDLQVQWTWVLVSRATPAAAKP